MQVFGTVVAVEHEVQVAKNGGGTYPGTRFSYRDEAGALKEKGIHNNAFKFNATLKTQLSNLNPGQKFVMDIEKKGEFWNINSVLPVEQAETQVAKSVDSPYTNKPSVSPKSTYETPEERAKKQVYIVRQSSITAAINYRGTKVSIEDIITTAKQFEAYVFGVDFDDGMPMSMKSDDIEVN